MHGCSDQVLKPDHPIETQTSTAANRKIFEQRKVISLRWWQSDFCLIRRAKRRTFFYIFLLDVIHVAIERSFLHESVRADAGVFLMTNRDPIFTNKPALIV